MTDFNFNILSIYIQVSIMKIHLTIALFMTFFYNKMHEKPCTKL